MVGEHIPRLAIYQLRGAAWRDLGRPLAEQWNGSFKGPFCLLLFPDLSEICKSNGINEKRSLAKDTRTWVTVRVCALKIRATCNCQHKTTAQKQYVRNRKARFSSALRTAALCVRGRETVLGACVDRLCAFVRRPGTKCMPVF